MFAAAGGGGRGGPWQPLTLQEVQPAHITKVTPPQCGGPPLYSLQSSFPIMPGAGQGCPLPGHRMVAQGVQGMCS